MSPYNAYARTQAETASQPRLMVMLFEKALVHMRDSAQMLSTEAKAERIEARQRLAKASAIVGELARTVDRNQAPELATHLEKVYLFVSQRLTLASLRYDAKAAQEAAKVFQPLVEAFSQAVAQLGAQP